MKLPFRSWLLPLLSIGLLILTACDNREKRPIDTTDYSADLAEMEAEALLKAAAQAHQDSITLDSIRRDSLIHATPFAAAIPVPATLLSKSHKARAKYLEGLGFKGNAEFESETTDGDACSAGSYRLVGQGGESCRVSWADINDEIDIKVTINGDGKSIDKFYKLALRLESADRHTTPLNVTRSGNTVSIIRHLNPIDELPAL